MRSISASFMLLLISPPAYLYANCDRGAPRYRVSVPYRGEHRQAAERAAADVEGHPAAAELGEPGD
jgi:hypothetical protein